MSMRTGSGLSLVSETDISLYPLAKSEIGTFTPSVIQTWIDEIEHKIAIRYPRRVLEKFYEIVKPIRQKATPLITDEEVERLQRFISTLNNETVIDDQDGGGSIEIGGVVVAVDQQKVIYMEHAEKYETRGLPWRIIRLIATDEPDGRGRVATQHLGVDIGTLGKVLSRMDKKWKEAIGYRLFQRKDGYVVISPLRVNERRRRRR